LVTDLTERLICGEDGLNFALFLFLQAVLDLFLPVASLLLNVESKTSWTTDGLQTLFFLNNVVQIRNKKRIKLVLVEKKSTDEVHWMTSRQLSPSPACRRNHSPASLALHNSFSKLSSSTMVGAGVLLTSSMQETNSRLLHQQLQHSKTKREGERENQREREK